MQVSDVMTRQVLSISPQSSIRDLARLLTAHRISGVPVLDEEGNLLGVVSQTDLAAYASQALPPDRDSQQYYEGFWLTPPGEECLMECLPLEGACVADIMAPYAFYASEDTGLVELADLMLAKNIHRILVLRQGKLVGIVSSLDLIRALREQLQASVPLSDSED